MKNSQQVNREYKDSIFKFIFGNETRKEYTLSIFNMINNSNYEDASQIEITTNEDIIYISMKNDVAFILYDDLNIYEQQSSWNPNMPLRCLSYCALQYQTYLTKRDYSVYSSRQIYLPTPKLVCFYNGKEDRPMKEVLKLSDAYGGSGDVEARVTVYNLNKNEEMLERCKPLYEYSYFVKKVNEYKEKYGNLKLAINKAIDEVPNGFEIRKILQKERNEIMSILQTEYDQDKYGEAKFKDGFVEGKAKGKTEGLKEGAMKANIATVKRMYTRNKPIEEIADDVGLSIDQVKEILDLSNNKTNK